MECVLCVCVAPVPTQNIHTNGTQHTVLRLYKWMQQSAQLDLIFMEYECVIKSNVEFIIFIVLANADCRRNRIWEIET